MAVEAAFLRRIYKGDPALGLLFTFGLAMFLEQTVRAIWGTLGIPFQIPEALRGPSPSGHRLLEIPLLRRAMRHYGDWRPLVIPGEDPYGTIIRAGSRDPDMVRMLGISLKPVFTAVFGLGVALAAVSARAGVPAGGVEPSMGTNTGTFAFVVVVIGGLAASGARSSPSDGR